MDRIRRIIWETPTKRDTNVSWRAMWKLNSFGTIKHFFWRVCLDLFPFKSNLAKTKIVRQSACPILWECHEARDVQGENMSHLKKLAVMIINF